MTNTRIAIQFPAEIRDWLDAHHSEQGQATLSKMVVWIVSEYVRARAKPGQTEEKRPLTPIEERDRIVEEMGRLEQQHYEKFAAIRQLNSEAPASVKNVDDLKKRIDSLWERICQRGGSVEYHNRAVAISRQDLSIYEELGNLHFRKRAIEKKLQAGQTQPSNSA